MVLNNQYDSIFKSRFHGASNIHGIRYQILYSIYRSFDLLDEEKNINLIKLEGIDDVDIEIKGVHISNQFIQVKSSKKPWVPSNLKSYHNKKGVLENFLDELRIYPNSKFTLVLSCELKGDIQKIANYKGLDRKEKVRIQQLFKDLCFSFKATKQESDLILNNLEIISINEDVLYNQINQSISINFKLETEIIYIYFHHFVSIFLDWAQLRKEIRYEDISGIHFSIKENLSRANDLPAYGKRLIERVDWDEHNLNDFYLGKSVRPGMIAQGVPVKRKYWLQKIEDSFKTHNTCIIRSSSGQGKSTLLYQYIYDNWPKDSTYIIRLLETEEQIQNVRSFLINRKEVRLPLFLVIDNAGFRTRFWADITQECARLAHIPQRFMKNNIFHTLFQVNQEFFELSHPYLGLWSRFFHQSSMTTPLLFGT